MVVRVLIAYGSLRDCFGSNLMSNYGLSALVRVSFLIDSPGVCPFLTNRSLISLPLGIVCEQTPDAIPLPTV